MAGIDPIELDLWRCDLGQAAECREKIDGGQNGRVIHPPSRDGAFPADNQRHTNAALVQAPFSSTKTSRATGGDVWSLAVVVSPGGGAVVAGQDEQCFFTKPKRVNVVDEAPELFVHLIEHGIKTVRKRPVGMTFVALEKRIAGHVSIVNIIEPELEIKRIALVAIDEVDGFIDVSASPSVFGIDLAIDARSHSFGVHEMFFKPVGAWQRGIVHIASAAHVPLAVVRRYVASRAERPGDCRGSRIQKITHASLPVAFPSREE